MGVTSSSRSSKISPSPPAAASASGVSVEGEDALVVAGMKTPGVGDAGAPGAAEGADDQVADGGVGIGLVAGADLLEILAEGLVPDVVLAVLAIADGESYPAAVNAHTASASTNSSRCQRPRAERGIRDPGQPLAQTRARCPARGENGGQLVTGSVDQGR
jgi:hypothetical protein